MQRNNDIPMAILDLLKKDFPKCFTCADIASELGITSGQAYYYAEKVFIKCTNPPLIMRYQHTPRLLNEYRATKPSIDPTVIYDYE